MYREHFETLFCSGIVHRWLSMLFYYIYNIIGLFSKKSEFEFCSGIWEGCFNSAYNEVPLGWVCLNLYFELKYRSE